MAVEAASLADVESVDEVEDVRFTGERGRLDGELSEGEKADEDEERGREAIARWEASTSARRTRRACKPKLRTFVAVSLLVEAAAATKGAVAAALPFADPADEKDLSAARTCAGFVERLRAGTDVSLDLCFVARSVVGSARDAILCRGTSSVESVSRSRLFREERDGMRLWRR